MKKHFTIGQLFGLGKGAGLGDNEQIKQAAYGLVGKGSLKEFTQQELDEVCWEFISRKKGQQRRVGMATDRQLYKIAEWERVLGWDKEPERLRGFLSKYHHVEDVKWLSASRASKVIDGLKALAAKRPKQ